METKDVIRNLEIKKEALQAILDYTKDTKPDIHREKWQTEIEMFKELIEMANKFVPKAPIPTHGKYGNPIYICPVCDEPLSRLDQKHCLMCAQAFTE